MRSKLEALLGEVVLLHTTFGHTFSGMLTEIDGDIVELLAASGESEILLNLRDISSVRRYQEEA